MQCKLHAADGNALAGLAAAFSDDDDDAAAPGAGVAITGDGRTLAQCKQDQKDNCLTEPSSGLRYRCARRRRPRSAPAAYSDSAQAP